MTVRGFLFLLLSVCCVEAVDYRPGPEAQRRDGAPQGKVTEHSWNQCKAFPGTTRSYWVYVPAQYDGKKPANLMVFQDGGGFVREKGHTRVPIVFDNLTDKSRVGRRLTKFNLTRTYEEQGVTYNLPSSPLYFHWN